MHKDQEEEVAERFKKTTAGHEMTILHDCGVYRHVRFMRPDNEMYWFEVVTSPGQLTFSGDGESFTFRRLPDMFQFFRHDEPNPWYWGEKLACRNREGILVWSHDKFIKWVKEEAETAIQEGKIAEDQVGRFWEEYAQITDEHFYGLADAWGALSDFQFWNDDEKMWRAEPDFCFDDGDFEMLETCVEYHWWFLWACNAIPWAVAQYDAAKAK